MGGIYIEGDHLWPLSYGWYSAGGEWGSQGGPSVVILMVVDVGSGGVEWDHLWPLSCGW